MGERAGGEFGHQFHLREQRVADTLFQAFDLGRFTERLAMQVLHQEIVDRITVHRGVDAGIDDVGSRQMDTACNAIEQAGMVGCDHADQSCAAFFVWLAVD